MQVDVEGREGLEPVVGPSQDAERQDVQLMDLKTKDMRVIRVRTLIVPFHGLFVTPKS